MITVPVEVSAVRQRLVRGFGATALGPLVTVLVQLSTVPLLLHAWGAVKYGDWVLLSAIPSYLALSDLGFGNASGSDMTFRVAAGDQQGALRTFQSSWALLTAISIAAFLGALSIAWWIPWREWFRLSSLSSHDAAFVVLILGAYALLIQQNGIFESGFRCTGHFATGAVWGTAIRFLETLIATVIAVEGGSFRSVAIGYFSSRAVGTYGYALLLSRKTRWIRVGICHARWAAVCELASPAFGFVAFPLAQALSSQGFVIIVGALQGPLAVTAFSTIRTLTRLNSLVTMAVGRALWPELSFAFGAGKVLLARKLHRRACQASLGLSALSALALGLAGPLVYRMWVHGEVRFNPACFHVLLFVSIASSFWYTSSVVPMSTNSHQRLAVVFFAATSLSLAIGWVLTPLFGITGAAVALLGIDAAMSCLVLDIALTQVKDTVAGFTREIFTTSPLLHLSKALE